MLAPLANLNYSLKNESKIDSEKISVKKESDEIIKISGREFKAEKYILNGSTNPKDKGPFPQYTLWYAKNGELLKFQFKNWKDKKTITTIRNNWNN